MAGSPLIGYFRRNVFWIIVSLVVSFALWTIVSTPAEPEHTLSFDEVPLRIDDLRQGLTIRDESFVSVRVIGPTLALRDLDKQSLRASVDASILGAGQHRLPVRAEAIDPRVRVDTVSPSTVVVLVETASEKNVPIIIRPVGTVPFGYSSGVPTTARNQAVVRGPTTVVDTVDAAMAEIDLSNATTSISELVPLIPVGSELLDASLLEMIPQEVRVAVAIDQQLVYKTVPVTPNVIGQVALGYQIVGLMVDPVSLTLVGQPSALERVDSVQIEQVDVTDASGDMAVLAEAVLESGIGLTRPQSIIVRVLISPLEGSATLTVGPRVVEAPPGKVLRLDPPQILVTVSGPLPTLQTVRPSDLNVTVNASGLTTDTLEVEPKIDLPASLRLVAFEPEVITLRVASNQSTKTILVAPTLIGTVADGYQVTGVLIEPSNVTVTGQSSILDDLNSLATEPIDISGRDAPFESDARLEISQAIEVLSSSSVRVKLLIDPVEGSKRFTIPVTVSGLNNRYTVDVRPGEIEVTVVGPILELRDIEVGQVVARIDASGLPPGSYSLKPTVQVPVTARLRAIEPIEVSVLIT